MDASASARLDLGCTAESPGGGGDLQTPDAWASSLPSYLNPRQVSSAACRDHRLTLGIPRVTGAVCGFHSALGARRFLYTDSIPASHPSPGPEGPCPHGPRFPLRAQEAAEPLSRRLAVGREPGPHRSEPGGIWGATKERKETVQRAHEPGAGQRGESAARPGGPWCSCRPSSAPGAAAQPHCHAPRSPSRGLPAGAIKTVIAAVPAWLWHS